MSTATLIEKLTGRRRADEQKTLDTYRDLVIAVADDADIDAARADAILLDAAKTPAQLEADVRELRQRRADVELAGKLPELRQQREALGNAQRSIRDVLREAEEKYRVDSVNGQRQIAQVDNAIHAAEQAAIRLRSGRPDPREGELRAERGRLQQRRGALVQEIGNDGQGHRGRLASLRLALRHGPQPFGGDGTPVGHLPPSIVPQIPFDETALRHGIDVTEMYLRGCETELKTLDARLAEIDSTLAAIERNQMTP
ncbi:MAG TPA: hypothetical protein VF278_14875 [Pirellulales bacterium]